MTAAAPLEPPDPMSGFEVCQRCGQQHVYTEPRNGKQNPTCRAHTSAGKPCRKYPIAGSVVCRTHGGGTPQVQRKAQGRVAIASMIKQGKIGAMLAAARRDDEHPLDALLESVRSATAMVRVYEGLVSELGVDVDAPPELWGVDDQGIPIFRMPKNLYGRDHTGDGAPHTLVAEYRAWMNFQVRACKLALDANIDERLVRQATLTSDLYFTAFRNSVAAAGLSPEQAKAFSAALAAELRKLGGPLDTPTARG